MDEGTELSFGSLDKSNNFHNLCKNPEFEVSFHE
jgi:hypothetical protein